MGTLKRLVPVAAALLLMIGITAVFYGWVLDNLVVYFYKLLLYN